MGSASPLVTFEITGSTQAQALGTTDQLVRRFEQSVIDLQGVYRVAPADLITPRRLDLGTNLEESDARVKRALVGVAGAGLLLTVALHSRTGRADSAAGATPSRAGRCRHAAGRQAICRKATGGPAVLVPATGRAHGQPAARPAVAIHERSLPARVESRCQDVPWPGCEYRLKCQQRRRPAEGCPGVPRAPFGRVQWPGCRGPTRWGTWWLTW